MITIYFYLIRLHLYAGVARADQVRIVMGVERLFIVIWTLASSNLMYRNAISLSTDNLLRIYGIAALSHPNSISNENTEQTTTTTKTQQANWIETFFVYCSLEQSARIGTTRAPSFQTFWHRSPNFTEFHLAQFKSLLNRYGAFGCLVNGRFATVNLHPLAARLWHGTVNEPAVGRFIKITEFSAINCARTMPIEWLLEWVCAKDSLYN